MTLEYLTLQSGEQREYLVECGTATGLSPVITVVGQYFPTSVPRLVLRRGGAGD